jgi:hypothetical protein
VAEIDTRGMKYAALEFHDNCPFHTKEEVIVLMHLIKWKNPGRIMKTDPPRKESNFSASYTFPDMIITEARFLNLLLYHDQRCESCFVSGFSL